MLPKTAVEDLMQELHEQRQLEAQRAFSQHQQMSNAATLQYPFSL